MNSVIPTPNPDVREVCVELVSLEVERARNEAFDPGGAFQPTSAYRETFDLAQRNLRVASERTFLTHDALKLPEIWLAMMGYRFCAEFDFLYGGVQASLIRAGEILNQAPSEFNNWTIETLFNQYVNTKLVAEWNYNGTQFRYHTETE